MFDNKKTELTTQHFVVREYFTKICEEDPWGLNCQGFFKRVCNSIANNGLNKTCEIYNLDKKIISLVEIKK